MKSTLSGWFRSASIADVIALSRVQQLNPIDYQKLYHSFRSFEAMDKASEDKLVSVGLTRHQAVSLKHRDRNVQREEQLMDRHQIGLLVIGDAHYPTLLSQITDPPLWLYYRGNTRQPWPKALSIVGTRKPSMYAQAALELLLPNALLSKIVTVSGLAYGVDTLVHHRSLYTNAATVAVLSGGLDSVYPSENRQCAESIVDSGGLLLSEYPPLLRPQPYRFPIRNRIVAGLSRATVIIEAKAPSGTLTTAVSAIDYNRELFVLPGQITDKSSSGSNSLIKSGATLCDDPRQIAELFGIALENAAPRSSLDTPEGQLLHLLTDQPLTMDEIVVRTGQGVENILGLITRLELSGELFQDGTGRYSAKK